MTSRITRTAALAVALGSAVGAPSTLATNGYFAHGQGSISKGMAGTGTALAQDALGAAANPAGLAFVGQRLDTGIELFSPRRKFEVEGSGDPQPGTFYLRPGERESANEGFLIPHFGFNRTLGEQQTLGVAIYGNGGMNTEYDSDDGGAFFGGEAGVDLMQLFIAPTWTWRYGDDQAIGVSPIIAWQRFEMTGVGTLAAFSADPENLSDNGHDEAWGYGVQLGWQGQLSSTLRAGLSWRSTIRMGELDRYAGLFAEQGDFDIPQMFSAGIAWSGIPDHWLALDVEHIRYGEVASVGNRLLPNLVAARLGDDAGAGFGWDDVTTAKLGWQWQQNQRQSWRAGVSYAEQPIPSSEVLFNILAPGVQEWHFTGGFSRRLTEHVTVSAMAFYSPEKTVEGPNPLGPGQTIELSMYQLGGSLSLGWQF